VADTAGRAAWLERLMLAPYQPDALRARWARTITYASGPYRDAAANGCTIHS